ncbi:Peptidyl-prolyl cis-trans isomerase 1 [Hordeum vulgare]|nr:Peptidyl-prolyl cis-trans isomerase 1 [Hordeum vulgare]
MCPITHGATSWEWQRLRRLYTGAGQGREQERTQGSATVPGGREEEAGRLGSGRRPDPEGQVISATTHADAAACLGELRAKILAGRASFADLAVQHSDCSSARCDIDLDLVVFDLLYSAFVQSQNFSVITSIFSTFWFGS